MLKRSIAQTLFLVITLLAFVVVVAMAGLFRTSLQRGFRAYVQSSELRRLEPLANGLLARYAERGSWDFLQPGEDIGAALLRLRSPASSPADRRSGPADAWRPASGYPAPPPFGPEAPVNGVSGERPFAAGDGGMPPGQGSLPGRRFRGPGPGLDALSLGPRAALLDADGRYLAGNRDARTEPRRPLYFGSDADQKLVGFLVLTEPPAAQREAGEEFVASQLHNLLGISVLVLLLSAMAALGLATYFRRPLRALTTGTQRIADGDFSARLPATRRDELGRLAADFNRMVEKLQAFEQARRQWVADSSHELRTPLTVLATHLEALRDGVLPASPEKLQLLSRTVADMNRLVDDLYQLATADAGAHDYRYESVPVAGLLDELDGSFTPRLAAQQLQLKVHDGTPPGSGVRADRLRLMQVLGNLLTNSGRYTDAGGEVLLTAMRWQDSVEFVVEDSAPGVPAEALARLFDRFYRVDVSRSRQSGGSGLGLAICRAIVGAHGGTITAAASPLGGLKVTVSLPLARRTSGTSLEKG